MKLSKTTAVSFLCFFGLTGAENALSADDYAPGTVYWGGDQACHNGDLYRAKWWAGPNDHPTDVDTVAEPWDTPWERLESDSDACFSNPTANRPPVVEAFATPAVPDPSGQIPVELVAEASDPDGDELSFFWQQLPTEAPSVTVQDADLPNAFVIIPQVIQPLEYRFTVQVSDGQAVTSAEVSVEVLPDPGNQSPVAEAVASTTEITGAESVQLSALGSFDPDGDPLSYQWQQLSPEVPQAVFSDANSAEPLVDLPAPTTETTYVFELLVSDGLLTDQAQVTVVQLLPDGNTSECPGWSASTVYVNGDVVTHNSQLWKAHWWTLGEEPGTTGQWGVWRPADSEVQCDGGTGGGTDPGTDPSTVRLSDLLATEAELTSSPLMQLVKESIRTADNATVEAITPGHPASPDNVQRVESIISEADWDYLFPRRAPKYTYTNFLRGIGKFPAFCGDYADGRDAEAICRKALATMFAHFTQETGGHTAGWPEPEWRQGLVYVRELGWSEDMANGYGLCDPGTWQGNTWPCGVFEPSHPDAGQYKSYFGRGAKQLSYNYNYGPFSQAMFGDVRVLLNEPNRVADTWLNLASAVFFYVYPQPPKPSMLFALDGTWVPNQHDLDNGLVPGLGVTTQIINGGIECGGTTEQIQSLNRISYYLEFADYLGVPVPADEVLGCASMQRFDTQGSGALAIYWDQEWSQPSACKLVNYQTQFSALAEGEYVLCVDHYFDVTIDYDH